MTPYRHVLCPIDFSDVSRNALEWSAAFARELQADLTVLHVVDSGLLAVGNLVAVPNVLEELRLRGEESLIAWKREIDLSRAKTRIVDGVPENVILETAESGVDLVVMGTHGISGVQKLLLGSVTERVLHRLQVPLLTLSGRDGAARIAERPRRIVTAIDFGPESQNVVRHAVWLAQHYGAALVAAHFVSVPYVILNDRTLERLGPERLHELEESLTAERRDDLRKLLPESPGSEMEIVVRVGSPFESLRDLLRSRSADLLVMGAGGHGGAAIRWLGSTCHKMVRLGDCPVLIVR